MTGEQGPHVLSIAHLQLRFGRRHILRDLSLDHDGGTLAVIGNRGSGKTALCHCITGHLRPTSGTIKAFGTNILGQVPSETTAMGIGYVPQRNMIWPFASVDGHLNSAAGQRQSVRAVDEVYDLLPPLARARNTRGADLSNGQRKLLAIGRCLISGPRLMVIDSPCDVGTEDDNAEVIDGLRALEPDAAPNILITTGSPAVAEAVTAKFERIANGAIVTR